MDSNAIIAEVGSLQGRLAELQRAYQAVSASVEHEKQEKATNMLEAERVAAQAAARLQEMTWQRESERFAAQSEIQERSLTEVLQANDKAATELAVAESAIARLEQQELWLAARDADRAHPRDMSALPKLVLRSLVAFMDKADLARAAQVCHRWSVTLDRGYLWKVLAARDADADKGRRIRETREAERVALPARSVTIALNNVSSKAAPNKEAIFAMGLKSMQRQVAQAHSEREDLHSRAQSLHGVIDFLAKQLAETRHQAGLASVELGSWLAARDDIVRRKAAMDKQTVEYEAQIQQEIARRDKLLVESEAAMKFVDARIQVVADARAHADSLTTAEQKDSTAQLAQLTAQLKKQKKVLVKGVKQLRAELEQVVAERDEFWSSHAQLKVKLDALAL